MVSLFEKIGSLTAVKNLADEFYDVMECDPCAKELRAIHPGNLLMSKRTMYRFLSHWSGGPKLFKDEYTNGKWLELRHRNVELNELHQKQWLYCMQTAMQNLEFKPELIEDVLARFSSLINSMIAHKKSRDDVQDAQVSRETRLQGCRR